MAGHPPAIDPVPANVDKVIRKLKWGRPWIALDYVVLGDTSAVLVRSTGPNGQDDNGAGLEGSENCGHPAGTVALLEIVFHPCSESPGLRKEAMLEWSGLAIWEPQLWVELEHLMPQLGS